MAADRLEFGFMVLPRSLEETRAAARAGEEAGFAWMGVADSPTVYQESYLHQLEAARATERMRIGPMASHVVARHPVIVANLLATLNEFTGGRAVGTLATGNSAARGLKLKPATIAQLGEAVRAIRSIWRGEGGRYGESEVPPTGLERRGCPIVIAADGPRSAALAGEVADGVVYGSTLKPEVLAARLRAARRREDQRFWVGPAVSLEDSVGGVRDELGAMVVAMANRAFRGDLAERGVPEDLHEDVRAMWASYDYGFHADATRPRNIQVVSDLLAEHLVEHFCVWGDEARWRERLDGLRAQGVDGVMFILGQADQPRVVRAIGERLQRLGLLAPQAAGASSPTA